jgi:hypothetical protein
MVIFSIPVIAVYYNNTQGQKCMPDKKVQGIFPQVWVWESPLAPWNQP